MAENIKKCSWVGDGENCNNLPIVGKNYCQRHYNRVYMTIYPEMADYIIEKEQNSVDHVLIKTYN